MATRIRKLIPAACVVAVFATAAGIAYATIPDENGVIHGCRNNGSGFLRVIDSASQSCGQAETALDWNQRGPSDGWDAQLFGNVPTGGSDVQLAGQVTGITPGSYLLSGFITWPALDTGSAYVFCNLVASGTDVSGSTSGGFGTASTDGGGTVAMMGAITVNSGTASVWVECRENAGTASVSVGGRLHAIQVGTLH